MLLVLLFVCRSGVRWFRFMILNRFVDTCYKMKMLLIYPAQHKLQ
jgi:hypothetical protein